MRLLEALVVGGMHSWRNANSPLNKIPLRRDYVADKRREPVPFH